MTRLVRYLIRQNLFLLTIILLIGVGIYILTDLFELLDRFLEAELGFAGIAWYYLVKTPGIIAQLLPAIFLLSLVLQLNFLARTNELIALAAGGISPAVLLRFILCYAFFWGTVQFICSEAMGVSGERISRMIWTEQIQKKERGKEFIENLWFTDKNNIIHVGRVFPNEKVGEGLRIYVLEKDGLKLKEIITAQSFEIERKRWVLRNGSTVQSEPVHRQIFSENFFPITQDLKAFLLMESWNKPEQLPLWELGTVIKRLRQSGSNVESLRTVWHNKLSYAASLLIMGILALNILKLTQNVYRAVLLCLTAIFFFYSINTISISFGKNGAIPAVMAAWFTNATAFVALSLCLLWPYVRNKLFPPRRTLKVSSG